MSQTDMHYKSANISEMARDGHGFNRQHCDYYCMYPC